MATYTSIPAFTSGQVLTSSVMNDVKNNLDLANAQSAYPYRSLLYNGAMQISQRAAVGSAQTGKTTSGFYTADRWQHLISSLGTWTDTTIADAPTGSGFRNSFKTECTTADASPAAGDFHAVRQQLEGQDLQRLAKGTSSAQALVLTFWVKSNVTGTYVAELEDQDNTRSISKSYTISASGTWEKKELTFAGDTTGVLDNDNNASFNVNFWLGAGSTYTSGTLATSWGTRTDANRAVGQVNVGSATSQYWQVTGVQLEVGSVSTPFEFLPYGDELARCQRYFVAWGGGSLYEIFGHGICFNATGAIITVVHPVDLRTIASTIASSTLRLSDMTNAYTVTSLTIDTNTGRRVTSLNAGVAAGLTQYRPYALGANNSTSAYLHLGAEL